MSVAALYHSFTLPWTVIQEEIERLKRIFVVIVAATVVFGLVIPFIPVKKIDRSKAEEIPPRFAQLVMEKQKPPPPKPKPKPKPEKKKPEKKKPEKKKPEKKKPKPKPKPKKKPEKTAEQKRAEARKKASTAGLLAFADELSDLRDKPVTSSLKRKQKLSKGASARKMTRSVLTSNEIATSSGGINTAALSKGFSSGTSLKERETTKVESGIEKLAKRSPSSQSSSGSPQRSFEEVTMVFDRNKGKIYNLYNRELRKDPSISGKIVFELTIAADGSVLKVKIVSSELNSPKLERKLRLSIKRFNFGSKKGADTLVITYPLDFVPS